MNLIINTQTKLWHISAMKTLGKDEIIIEDYIPNTDVIERPHLYKVNDTNDNLILDTEKVNKEYITLRQNEYAKLNQDEMRFDDLINGTTTWQDSINKIKVKYPKPE